VGPGQEIAVGVNKFVEDTAETTDILRVDPESERQQVTGKWTCPHRTERPPVSAGLGGMQIETICRYKLPPS
jgi:methylmalonyl-CoA mutase N-terminal domain/subunit